MEEKNDSMLKQKTIARTKTIEDYIFVREASCPVCSEKVKITALKSSGLRPKSRDTDLMYYYEIANPLFYDVWVCEKCGYAALSSLFNTLTDTQIKQIKESICSRWKSKEYPKLYDEDIAIERLKLALLNTVVKNGRSSEKALICLKLGWICRLKEYKEDECRFLSQAITGFEQAYNSERFPVSGMDEYTLMYLLGELNRRTGKNTEALKWFGKVITNPVVKQSLKDMARDQKELIKNTQTQ